MLDAALDKEGAGVRAGGGGGGGGGAQHAEIPSVAATKATKVKYVTMFIRRSINSAGRAEQAC